MVDVFLQWTAVFGFVCVGVFFLLELRRWNSLASVISRKQRILRVVLIVLAESLFVLMFVGPWVLRDHNPLNALLYYTVCLVIGLAVVVLALLDLREVVKGYAALNRRMFSDLRREDRRDPK